MVDLPVKTATCPGLVFLAFYPHAYFHVTVSLLLLLEEFLKGAPEASFVLLATPLAEGGVVILLCPTSPL